MKKLLLVLIIVGASNINFAQEQETGLDMNQETDLDMNMDYNKWSIEVAGGMHKPSRPFADGYYAHTPSFGQFSLGVRYMFNDRFGLRGNAGYSTIKNDDNSLEFKSNFYTTSLQGVINLGNVLRFSDWTNSIGLLAHGGSGYSLLSTKEPVELDNDPILSIIGGLTPQVKLGERVAIFTDISVIGNINQDYTWDGTERDSDGGRQGRGFTGFKVDFSIGLSFYLGSNEKHADWAPREDLLSDKVSELEQRLAKVETDLIDSDQDGVPDYLDREPNTISGVTVDTKGVAVDKNRNGIPDELEPSLDNRYVNESDYVAGSTGGDLNIADLLNKGYVNVYFKFNSSTPETYSLEAINYLIKYMKDHPSANAELIGYADEIGNPAYNSRLSEQRAKRVYDILLAAGINGNRLTYTGNGEDSSVDKGSAPARQLVRRVTFRLK